MEYFIKTRRLLKALALYQVFRTAICVKPTWSCYQETGSCYYVHTVPSTRLEASCWCRSAGGHLVKIDSHAELNVVRQVMANETGVNGYGFYIGATDMRNENQFVWYDGTDATEYIMWAPEEPTNDFGYGHCVVMHDRIRWETNRFLQDFMAFDITCGKRNNFVCERGLTYPRFWEMVSHDETYPSASLGLFSKVSCVECSHLCMKACECMSFGCMHQQDGDCMLYKEHYSRLNDPAQSAPGYVVYD